MFIKKEEYYNLCDCEKINKKLEEEIKRLEYMLNTREKTCKIGSWCLRCEHWVEDKSVVTSSRIAEYGLEDMYYGLPIPEYIGGKVGYCNKYVDTLCSDFKLKD